MTVEVKIQEAQVSVVSNQPEEDLKVVKETERVAETEKADEPTIKAVEKSSSYREESNFLSDLKEHEKKALNELKSKLQNAILGNHLFKSEKPKENPKYPEESEKKPAPEVTEDHQSCEEAEQIEDSKKEEKCEEEKAVECVETKEEKIEEEIILWGVPLLPSKGAETESTDVILLKFLRAREFKPNEAFEMLKKTLQWRKEFKTDSILDEDLGADLSQVGYMSGTDREGHPICYNVFGGFGKEEIYEKAFGTAEKREGFMRWRVQLMEKGVRKLDFKAGGVNSLLQINDLKNSPGPSKKELRIATKQAVGIFQDNYPEFVARNIFINVPFWYYAFNALLSPFLTQRTKSKFVVARPGKVTETLLKYIPVEEIPIQYGGLKRDNDFEFSLEDGVSEYIITAGSTITIEIPAPEVGATLIWDVTVVGWEVCYKEEFIPADEGSYTIIVQKARKMGANEGPVRNTYMANEVGKMVLTIDNWSSKKKKVLCRNKTKKSTCF
ncbi:hypothetical protein U1Q18_010034 [Sarracenia purpurea var. burkii]